jgi:hypothetical protein
MTSLKNITNKTSSLLSNNTSGEEYYYGEYGLDTMGILLAILFGASAGFLLLSLLRCCVKK